MSGIYIQGLQMPKQGEMLCVDIYSDGKITVNLDLECKKIAEAIPVSNHGRLIDADTLIGRIEHDTPSSSTYEKIVRRYVENAPTIIHADKEGRI